MNEMAEPRPSPPSLSRALCLTALVAAGCTASKSLPPIHFAMRTGQSLAEVEAVIDTGVCVDQPDNLGRTPLYMAALDGNMGLVRLFLARGADPGRGASWKGGDTPLHAAARNGHADVVSALLDAGGSPDTPNATGQTPLHYAAWAKRTETVLLLLTRGARVQTRDRGGRTALNGIGVYGRGAPGAYAAVVECLLAAGLGPDTTEEGGTTPLMDASACGAVDVVALLLRHGAHVDSANANGWTALMCAAWSGNRDVTKCLVAAGADRRMLNSDGKTADQLARQKGTPID